MQSCQISSGLYSGERDCILSDIPQYPIMFPSVKTDMHTSCFQVCFHLFWWLFLNLNNTVLHHISAFPTGLKNNLLTKPERLKFAITRQKRSHTIRRDLIWFILFFYYCCFGVLCLCVGVHTGVCACITVLVGARGQHRVLFVNDAFQNSVWQSIGKAEMGSLGLNVLSVQTTWCVPGQKETLSQRRWTPFLRRTPKVVFFLPHTDRYAHACAWMCTHTQHTTQAHLSKQMHISLSLKYKILVMKITVCFCIVKKVTTKSLCFGNRGHGFWDSLEPRWDIGYVDRWIATHSMDVSFINTRWHLRTLESL